MEAKTYQGWTNYEIWAMALWLDNSESDYLLMREWSRAAWAKAPATPGVAEWNQSREDAAASQLADEIREYIEEQNPIVDASVFADLLNAALSEVNWQEVARHYLVDVIANDEETDSAVNEETKEQDQDEQHEQEKGTK